MSLPYFISWAKQNNATTFNINRVDGAIIYTDNNREIFDMTSISYQAHFGHNHPTIIRNIKEQLDSIPMSSPKGIYPHKNETTLKLLNYMQKPEGKIFYTTGGAETVENALKIARDITKKRVILARQNSYHGATMGALTVTGDWRNPYHQLPNEWVVRIPEPNEPNAIAKTKEIIQKIGAENIAGLIAETITGGNGVIIPTKEWWKEIEIICRQNKILIIMDEVICGFHRTGTPMGYMHYDVKPDLICLAKGISGGMIPFGALWTSKEVADNYEENILCCGLTNYAHPLGLSALKGVLEILDDQKFHQNLNELENVFKNELQKLSANKVVKEVRSIGMIAAVDLHQTIEWKKFFNNGIYLVSQTNRIILAPPLIMRPNELTTAMKRIEDTFNQI